MAGAVRFGAPNRNDRHLLTARAQEPCKLVLQLQAVAGCCSLLQAPTLDEECA